MAYRKKGGSSWYESTAEFLKKYWHVTMGVILAILMGYPLLVRWMRSSEARDKIAEANAQNLELEAINKNPQLQLEALNEITTNTAIHDAAFSVYHHLGFKYPWWDVRSWSENDELAYLAITEVSNGSVPNALVQCYHLISSGRSLRSDCEQVLDAEFYELLNW